MICANLQNGILLAAAERHMGSRMKSCLAVASAGDRRLRASLSADEDHRTANKYSPTEDVQLGQEAAAEVRTKLPIMKDDAVTSYIAGLGRQLVDVIPAEFQHSEFRYTFEAVNVREINAFALPGGPMFVNRGMIEAAGTEGESGGRDGPRAQSRPPASRDGAAKQGQQVSGRQHYWRNRRSHHRRTGRRRRRTGDAIHPWSEVLQYSREYEKQADLMGAQLMARAGYDARDMANMFKTDREAGLGRAGRSG